MLSTFKQFDAFPKLEPSSLRQTATGGLISLSVYISILFLSIYQVWAYLSTTTVEYSNFVDSGTTGKVALRVDLVVATSCSKLQIALGDQEMTRHFTLTSHQTNEKSQELQQENDFFLQFLSKILEQEIGQASCRIQGTVEIPKHSGTFTITPRRIPVAPNVYLSDPSANFSHKILTFSFGEASNFNHQMFNGMETNLEVTVKMMQKFTYNLCIVPTQYHHNQKQTIYQHAVNQYARPSSFPNGEPGIVVNYEFDPLSLHIRISRGSVRILLVKFLGIVAGLFATSKIMHSLLTA